MFWKILQTLIYTCEYSPGEVLPCSESSHLLSSSVRKDTESESGNGFGVCRCGDDGDSDTGVRLPLSPSLPVSLLLNLERLDSAVDVVRANTSTSSCET